MTTYQKIPSPFKRHADGPNRNKLIEGDWSSPELAATADLPWVWTEKVDGTNIRLIWDGHKVVYGGRTDNAQLPAKLVAVLDQLVPEELFEQKFGATPAVLYGEGYGAGIQSGGVYRPDQSFVLFDVRVGNWWLQRDGVEDVARAMGLDAVPLIFIGTIDEAIWSVKRGLPSRWADINGTHHAAEGLVGVTEVGLLNRAGERLIVKIKRKDFPKENPKENPA